MVRRVGGSGEGGDTGEGGDRGVTGAVVVDILGCLL